VSLGKARFSTFPLQTNAITSSTSTAVLRTGQIWEKGLESPPNPATLPDQLMDRELKKPGPVSGHLPLRLMRIGIEMKRNDQPSEDRHSEAAEPGRPLQRRITRRTFVRNSLAVGGGVVASMYVKPTLQSFGTPRVFAASHQAGGPCGAVNFWKNNQEYWDGTPYSTGHDFDTVFGTTGFGITLLAALSLSNRPSNRLMREGTAALLNATHVGITDYTLKQADVIAAVRGDDLETLEVANGGCL